MVQEQQRKAFKAEENSSQVKLKPAKGKRATGIILIKHTLNLKSIQVPSIKKIMDQYP